MSIGSTRTICQSERMKNAPLSSIRNIIAYSDKLEQEGRSIIHLELGEPDFGTPAHIIDACKKALDNQEVHYGPIAGTVELRKALSRHCTRYGLEYAPEEILVSTGVVHGVFLSMLAYLDPGDEILVPDPGYLIYFADPHIAQAKPVSYPLREENGFQLDAETLEALITPRTKAIVFNNPTNPTGMGYDSRTLELLARVAQEHDLLIAADEIYTTYLYEGDFCPIRTLPGMAERTITLNSFSKNFLMTGWRVGVIIAEPELLAVMNRVNGSLIYSAPSVSQRAAIQALAMRKEIREKYVTAYRDRIFYSADRIEKIPYLSLVRPKGTFYLFPGVEKTGLDEKAFCKVLLDQAHVLVSPGTPFGVSAAGHFRIACTVGIDRLKTAFDRMEKLSF